MGIEFLCLALGKSIKILLDLLIEFRVLNGLEILFILSLVEGSVDIFEKGLEFPFRVDLVGGAEAEPVHNINEDADSGDYDSGNDFPCGVRVGSVVEAKDEALIEAKDVDIDNEEVTFQIGAEFLP